MSYYQSQIYIKGKFLLFEALYRTGLCAISRRRRRHSVVVLAYHDILPPHFPKDNILFGMTVTTQQFEWQLDYIKDHYNVISLSQLCRWLSGENSLPPRSVLITFDDGHTNNLHYILPALRKRRMPAVCFVVTGNLGKRHLIPLEQGYARLMLPDATVWISLDGKRHPLGNFHDRLAACSYFFRLLQARSEEEQHKELENLRNQIPTEEDGRRFPTRFDFLSPDELCALDKSNIEIGAHTVTHPVLSTLSPERACAEIADSKAQLEEATGNMVRSFAYPFGQPASDFGERDKEILRKAGYELAFAAVPGFVNQHSDPFCLPRIAIGHMSRAQFIATISGTIAALKYLLGK